MYSGYLSTNNKISVVHLPLGYNQNLSVQLWGRNITDDKSILGVFGTAVQLGAISAFINQAGSYGASINYRF